MRSRPLAACALASALALGGAACGGHAGIDQQASDRLASAVASVRAAASAHDVNAAQARLDEVRRMVLSFRSSGELSDAAAGRILVAADAVGADLGLVSPATTSTSTTTATTTTTTPPPPAPPAKKDHHGRGNGGNGDNGD